MNKMYKKLFNLSILKRIYLERLGEPLLYNLVSLWILFFGNIKKKTEALMTNKENLKIKNNKKSKHRYRNPVRTYAPRAQFIGFEN